MLPCLDTAKPRHAAVGAEDQGCAADAVPASQGLRRARAGAPHGGAGVGTSATNTASATSAAAAGASVGAWVAGSDAPEKADLRIGFMSLTDCASVVMASALGLDRKYGLRITPVREASWASIRDKAVQGELDAVHALYGLVYGAQLGIGSTQQDMAILMGLNRNGQAITLSTQLAAQGARDGAGLRALMTRQPKEGRGYAFAQTFPTGTHAMWLYYWLAANGIDPLREAKVITVPPPQMVANMRAGNMDGFCVGEPWGAQAIADGIGFTVATTQSIWPDHPEKVLATTAAFAEQYPNTARAMVAALLETSRHIDASEANRRETAATIAGAGFVNADMGLILGRMLGHYDDGLGKTWEDPAAMTFHQDGKANFPFLSDGMWFMTQHKRWGLLKTHPDYLAVAKAVHRLDLYRDAAGAVGVAVPDSDFRTTTLMDDVTWNARDPAAYADGFAIKA